MSPARLVPDDFAVPNGFATQDFVLEPLGLHHNQSDHRAWTSSMAHIRGTPGFAGRPWPDEAMSLEDNAADLARHESDFEERTGFTYTVLDRATKEVIGCVYLYPSKSPEFDVDVRSWVRADRAPLDAPLHDAVCQWLSDSWPFRAPDYAAR